MILNDSRDSDANIVKVLNAKSILYRVIPIIEHSEYYPLTFNGLV